MIFLFVCLNSLSTIISRPIYIAVNSIISFFFRAKLYCIIYIYICIYIYTHTHTHRIFKDSIFDFSFSESLNPVCPVSNKYFASICLYTKVHLPFYQPLHVITTSQLDSSNSFLIASCFHTPHTLPIIFIRYQQPF